MLPNLDIQRPRHKVVTPPQLVVTQIILDIHHRHLVILQDQATSLQLVIPQAMVQVVLTLRHQATQPLPHMWPQDIQLPLIVQGCRVTEIMLTLTSLGIILLKATHSNSRALTLADLSPGILGQHLDILMFLLRRMSHYVEVQSMIGVMIPITKAFPHLNLAGELLMRLQGEHPCMILNLHSQGMATCVNPCVRSAAEDERSHDEL